MGSRIGAGVGGDEDDAPPARSNATVAQLLRGFTRRKNLDQMDGAGGSGGGGAGGGEVPFGCIADDPELELDSAGDGRLKGGYRTMLKRKKHTFRWLGFLHGKAAKKSERSHFIGMMLVILVSLVGGVLTPFLELFGFWKCTWSLVANTAFFSVIAAITTAKDTFGFQKNAERHEDVRREYERISETIEGALIRHREYPEEEIDLGAVFEEVQAAHSNLASAGRIDLPYSLERKYQTQLYPWLARQQIRAAETDAEVAAALSSIHHQQHSSFMQRLRGASMGGGGGGGAGGGGIASTSAPANIGGCSDSGSAGGARGKRRSWAASIVPGGSGSGSGITSDESSDGLSDNDGDASPV